MVSTRNFIIAALAGSQLVACAPGPNSGARPAASMALPSWEQPAQCQPTGGMPGGIEACGWEVAPYHTFALIVSNQVVSTDILAREGADGSAAAADFRFLGGIVDQFTRDFIADTNGANGITGLRLAAQSPARNPTQPSECRRYSYDVAIGGSALPGAPDMRGRVTGLSCAIWNEGSGDVFVLAFYFSERFPARGDGPRDPEFARTAEAIFESVRIQN
jgi:hypothetical protein